MGSSVGGPSRPMPNFHPSESLFGGPVLPQQPSSAMIPGSFNRQKTMPLPNAPMTPANPFPVIARRLLRQNGR